MKYLVRAIKYFVFLAIFLTLVVCLLVKMKIAAGDLSEMFVNGYDSLWQIALIMVAFAAVYPSFGYTSRRLRAPGSYDEIRPEVMKVMDELGYRIEKEDGENISFIKRAPLTRFVKLMEDRITFTRTIDGFDVEGLTKDVVRIISMAEYRAGGEQE